MLLFIYLFIYLSNDLMLIDVNFIVNAMFIVKSSILYIFWRHSPMPWRNELVINHLKISAVSCGVERANICLSY